MEAARVTADQAAPIPIGCGLSDACMIMSRVV